MSAAVVDDAAHVLLTLIEAARDQAAPRLSTSQLNALLVIEGDEGINLGGLAGQLRMILSSASRLCDRLVAAGMVERETGRADRREIALFLTPTARRLLRELRGLRRHVLTGVLERMSPAGRASLLRGLEEFARAADRDGDQARSA